MAPNDHLCRQWLKAMRMISIYHDTDKHMTVAHEVCPRGSSKPPQFLWYPKWPAFAGSGPGASDGSTPLLSATVKGEATTGNPSSLMCQQGHPSENTSSSSSWFHLPLAPSTNPQLTLHSSVCFPEFSMIIVRTPAKRLSPILPSLTIYCHLCVSDTLIPKSGVVLLCCSYNCPLWLKGILIYHQPSLRESEGNTGLKARLHAQRSGV